MADGLQDEEGGFDWSVDEDVIFLDEDEAADFDESLDLDQAGWPTEERVEGGRGPGGTDLPPSVPRSRVLISLLALAVLLGGTGSAFTTAYHRHVTDRRIANTLDLIAGTSPPTIPGLAALGLQPLWHAELEEQIVIPVVNRSPGPVVLLGAVLEEPGMTTAASLVPVGAATLPPGRTGTVEGDITVDCTQDPAAVFPFMDNTGTATVPLPNSAALTVRAETEGGRVGEAALDPDDDGPDLQVRICQQEGFDITGAPTIYTLADPRTHSVEVDLSVTSSSDVTLGYRANAAYAKQNQYGIANLSDTSAPEPVLPATGTVRSGGTIHVSFAIQVLTCPAQVQPTYQLYVEVLLTVRGNPVDALEESAGLAVPLAAACGKG